MLAYIPHLDYRIEDDRARIDEGAPVVAKKERLHEFCHEIKKNTNPRLG